MACWATCCLALLSPFLLGSAEPLAAWLCWACLLLGCCWAACCLALLSPLLLGSAEPACCLALLSLHAAWLRWACLLLGATGSTCCLGYISCFAFLSLYAAWLCYVTFFACNTVCCPALKYLFADCFCWACLPFGCVATVCFLAPLNLLIAECISCLAY